ncbi:MAG: NifU family protein [Alphaproteobacteria bacterium]|nr:NifU family protein [Alphaproteobacteria bacterium]
MHIEVELTPNPDVLKFLPGRSVTGEHIYDFPTEADHQGESPLVNRLFTVEGVQGVMLGADFISVTRKPAVQWATLRPMVLGAVIEHFQSGDVIIRESARQGKNTVDDAEDEMTAKIRELLELRVSPAVAMDGGDIQFHGFDSGVVYVTLRGACAGCPSATVTLKMGIENMLRHYIPEVTEVRTVA